jgi:cellobiose phosphorylase
MRNQEQRDARHHGTLQLRMGPLHDARDTHSTPYAFTEFFGHLMKQVEFCSLIRGYVQLSENSLIGIRDIFQALEALAYWRPDAARAKMLEALAFTLEDGRCLRQYSLPKK